MRSPYPVFRLCGLSVFSGNIFHSTQYQLLVICKHMTVSSEDGLLCVAGDFFDHGQGHIVSDQVADIGMAKSVAVAGCDSKKLAGVPDSGEAIGRGIGKNSVRIGAAACQMFSVLSMI